MSLKRVRVVFVVVFSLVASVLAGFPRTPVVSAQEAEPPFVAADDVVWTEVDSQVDVDVTDNDSDDSDDAIVLVTVDNQSSGTAVVVVVEDEPSVLFTPDAGFDGVASFTYEACVDGACSPADVSVYVGTSACTIVGTNGSDTLTGTSGDDLICALNGADVVNAGDGDDVVFGGRGSDTINGGPGSDLLRGSRGDDTISGGDGADILHGGKGSDVLTGNKGQDTLYGGRGKDSLNGGRGNDVLIGKAGDDTLVGGNGHDVLRGWRGADMLTGGDGNDELYGGRDADVLNGGDGDDLLKGKRGKDALYGDAGDDDLRGNRGDDDLDGGAGIDAVDGGNGTDNCQGETITNCENDPVGGPSVAVVFPETGEFVQGDGFEVQLEVIPPGDPISLSVDGVSVGVAEAPDYFTVLDGLNLNSGTHSLEATVGSVSVEAVIVVMALEDIVYCQDEIATIVGTDGPDLLSGTDGDDVIAGLAGDDVIDGLGGDDLICAGEGDDQVDAGPGADVVDGGGGNDTIVGGVGDDHVSGSDGDDVITGGAGTDYLDGDDGDDTISGGLDPDEIDGGFGDDNVAGDHGDDAVDGGGGTDTVDGGPDTDYCGGGETTTGCETEVPGVTETDLFDEFEPIELDPIPGPVEILAPAGMDPVRIVIDSPGGIYSNDVSITGNQIAAGSVGEFAVSPVYELSLSEGVPDFAASLTIPFRPELLGDTDPQDLRIATFDISKGRWQIVEGAQQLDAVEQTVTAQIQHFSSYVVIRYPSFSALIENEAARGRLDRIIEAQTLGCSTVTGAYPAAILADNPISYYRFGSDDPLADEQGLHRATGFATSVDSLVPSTNDGAAKFEPENNPGLYAGVYNAPDLIPDDFSFEVWINPDEAVAWNINFAQGVYIGPTNDASGVAVDVRLGGGSFISFREATSGGRSHVVLQKSADILTLIVNGNTVGARSVGNFFIQFHPDREILFPNTYGTDGVIDELAVYDYALGELGAARHHAAGLGDQDDVDSDGDLLPDCEEREGLLSFSWLDPFDDNDIDRTVLSVRLNGNDIDTDDDLLADGAELVAEEIATTDLLTADERSTLLDLGLTTIYRARSYPWMPDSDLDGTSDFVEFQNAAGDPFAFPQWDPLTPRTVAQLIDYPQSTLFQPEILGTAPFLGGLNGLVPIRNIETRGPYVAPTAKYYESTVLFDSNLQCTSNCQPLIDAAQQVIWNDVAYNCVAPVGPGRVCRELDDAVWWLTTIILRDQQVFETNVNSPSGVDIKGSVVGGQVFATCILYDIPCEEQNVDNFKALAALSSIPVGVVSREAVEELYQRDVGREARERLEDDRARERSQKVKRRRARIGIFASISLLASQLADVPTAAELEYVRRVDRCEEILELPNQQQFVNALPETTLVTLLGYGLVALDPCRGGIPIYYPGNDVPAATAHRADAIIRSSQPALLSHESGERALARLKTSIPTIRRRWYTPVEFMCVQSGSNCDEYPNFASGESGPYTRLGIRIQGNERSASLCLMSPSDNQTEGRTHYGPFKQRNGMLGEAGLRRYFLVIPDPLAPTHSEDVANVGDNWASQPRRVGAGSYTPPDGIDAADSDGRCPTP